MTYDIKPGKYCHYKGKEYEVLYTATHSETLEEMVVYRALYGEHAIWVRPAHMWNETVEKDGRTFKRFEYISDEQVEKVTGGADIVNKTKSEEELEKEDHERDLRVLQNLVGRRDDAFEDSMNLLSQITSTDDPSPIVNLE